MKTLTGLFVYPIKSLGAIGLTTSKVEARGLQYDRRYMLVDESGLFISQRKYPRMATLQVNFADNGFRVTDSCGAISPLELPFGLETGDEMEVEVWSQKVNALSLSEEVDFWFSSVLGTSCKLVWMPDTTHRQVDRKYTPEGCIASFADAYPYLIIGQASLDDLNSRMESPVMMNRFRPNFVFTGGEAYEEDSWKDLSIGDLDFQIVKSCGRCSITTVEQESGVKGTEPLKTLAAYRAAGDKILFGMNAIGPDEGVLKIGDEICLK